MSGAIDRGKAVGIALAAALGLLAGCDDAPPSGQVLASVGGDDVTKHDLAVESALTQLPPGLVTLNALVDRKLLVRRARREGLDRTPDYLAAVRRFREATLANLAVQQASQDAAPPSAAAVRAFIAAHPWRFAARRLVDVTQDGKPGVVDTATLADEADAHRLLAARPGQTVVLGGRTLSIIGTRPAPLSATTALDAARAAIVRQQREATVRRLIRQERASVRVRYQPGFGTHP